MEFFDELGKKISGAADYMANKTKSFKNNAATQTKNLSDISKLKSQKRIIEKNLTSYYYQLGKAYYENSGENCEYIYSELVAVIDKENKNLNDLIEKMDLINGTKRCKKCGASLSVDSIFCNICGAKLEEQPQPVSTNEPISEEELNNDNEIIESEKQSDTEEEIADTEKKSEEITETEEQSKETPDYEVTTAVDESTQRICSDCGFVIPKNASFCTNCGKKYE